MTRVFSFKGPGLVVWTVVAALAVGLFLYANHSTIASYKHGFGNLSAAENALPANSLFGSFEPALW